MTGNKEAKKFSKFGLIFLVLISVITIAIILLCLFGRNLILGNCKYNNTIYKNGDAFVAADGCNMCTCKNTNITCTEEVCGEKMMDELGE